MIVGDTTMRSTVTIVFALFIGLTLGGCSSYKADTGLMHAMSSGEFGVARDIAIGSTPSRANDKSYMLSRTKVILTSMADGVPQSTEGNADRLYDFLRTQGVNEGKEIQSFFSTESGATYWKGEPFEQAMSYSYLAAFDGTQGDWGNVRASASNSIFLIRDFSESIRRGSEIRKSEASANGNGSDEAQTPESRALADREAILADSQKRDEDAKGNSGKGSESDEFEYDLVESDFELGYLLQAIAADQLGLDQERDEHLRVLSSLSPRFSPLARTIRSGSYNTVVLVSYGMGPEKYGAGYDQVIEMYRPRTPSGDEPLVVRVDGQSYSFPVATDVNRLALDTRWTNLEGMRRAKSIVGTVLVGGGAAVIATADNAEQAIAGAAIALAGLLAKESAKADTRHCEILPQRTYIALLNLPGSGSTEIELQVENMPETKLVIPVNNLANRGSEAAGFHYVRLSSGSDGWRTQGQLMYVNDHQTRATTPTLPYILGGSCLRTPSPDLMDEYYAAGLPSDVTYNQLMEIYRDEGVVIAALTPGVELGRHICEGGNTLYSPDPISSGYVRLYCQPHPPYQPRGELLAQLLERMGVGGSAPLARID